ncbi:hypothetical protein GCM10011534_00170 [Pseudooceanicola nanhaiensis]|jgi:predicted nucleotidyltransferase|uniref:Polymerase nucleotidyl transferase domain-containing protein n=1 Tax=Pseudooceanicola nanhaiensis TaxID=375761 RepID=A0A917SJQ2_9RHOB|nr:nucleotidyltransferase domain-containing protein [Pseudooceanicola nanhaiensis]GGL82116.1 hypothetical protein GCM10011534_00170 [Pseudooceanicola nanhaiensis]
MLRPTAQELFEVEPRLHRLVEMCMVELAAEEVWLFGSRSRGDPRPGSDWDVLVVISDYAPSAVDAAPNVWQVKRTSGLPVDLLTVRASEFAASKLTVNTLSHAAATAGVKLDA